MSTKEVKVKVTGDVSDLLKKLEQAKDSIEDLGKGVNKSTNKGIDSLNNDLDELRKNAEKTADSLDDLYNATKKPSKNNFSGMADDITDVSKKINIAVNDIKDFSKQVDSLGNASLGKLNKSLIDMDDTTKKIYNSVKDAGENLFEGLDVNKLNKFKNSFGDITTSSKKAESSLAGTVAQTAALGSSVIIGVAGLSKLKNKIAETAAESAKIKLAMKDITDSMGSCALKMTSLADESEKLYGKITKASEKAFEAQSKLDHAKKFNNAEDIEKYSKEVIKYAEEVKKLGNEHHELSNKTNEVKAEVEQLVKKFAELSTQDKEVDKALKDTVETYNKYAKAARESGQAVDDIDYGKLINEALEAAKANDKVADSTDKAGDSLDKLKDKASGIKDAFSKLKDLDFSGAFKSFKDSGKGIFEGLGKGIESVGSKLSDFGSKLSGLGGIGGKLGSVLSSAGAGMSSLGASTVAAAGTLAKLTAAAVVVLGVMNKLYESGKRSFFEGLASIKDKLQPIVDAIKSFGREVVTAFESITGMDLSLSGFIEYGAEFEDSITRAGAVAGATGDDFEKLKNKAREMGAETRYSAAECADALYYMGMAGWDTKDMISGLEGVLNLATVADMDLAQASDFVTDGLTALGMSASQATDFVDMLAAASTSSNTSVAQMQSAFTNVAPIAGTLGISMSDLSVALGLMANNGVKAEKAGTALKNLLTNMASPTEKMSACIEKYNLQSAQKLITDGKLIEGIKEMKGQLDGLTAKEKTAVITTIAGKEALSGVSALLNSSVSDINKLEFAVDSSTKASKSYAQSLGLIDKNGKVLIKDFDNMTKGQQAAYEKWQNFNSVMDETVDVMTMVGGTTTDLGAIVAKLGEDGEVTADQVNSVLDVFDKLQNTSKETTDALKQYGIEVARNDDGSIDFSETLKNLGTVWDKLSDSEKETLAAQLGVAGSVDELNELYDDNGEKIEELVDAYEKCESVSEHLAKTFDATVKGSFKKLSSAIGETFLQTFDKIKPAVMSVSDTLTNFFDILNGMSEKFKGLKGLGDALKYLEGESRNWGKAIKTGIVDAVNSLDSFINGGSFDSVLKIGTNIIDGICKGISEAKENGSLDSAIDGFIIKICDWINQNGPKIQEAGTTIIDSITEGIERNEGAIDKALDTVVDIMSDWIESSGKLKSTGGRFADQFIHFALDKLWEGIKSWIREKVLGLGDLLNIKDLFDLITFPSGAGNVMRIAGKICEALFGKNPIEECKKWVLDKFKNFHPIQWIKEKLFKGGTTGKAQDSGNSPLKISDIFGNWHPIEDFKKWIEEKLNGFHPIKAIKDYLFGKSYAESKGGSSNNNLKPENIFGEWHPIEDFKKWVEQKIGNFHPIQWLKERLFKGGTTSKSQDSGNSAIKPEQLIKLPSPGDFKNWIQSKVGNWHPIQWIKEKLFGKGGTTSKSQDSGNSAIKPEQLIKLPSLDEIKGWIEGKIGDFHPIKWIQEKWNQVKDFGNDALKWVDNLIPDDLGTKISEKIEKVLGDNWFTDTIGKIFGNKDGKKADVKDLLNIDNTKLEETKKVLESLGETATAQAGVVKTAFTDIQNSARTSFVGLSDIARNQFINVSNIVRNQMVNCANIVRNQVVNMSNIFRNQFVNMSNIVRNQAVNMANIMRNQMVSCANIVRNQCVNMANIFRNQFVSMANVARNQMVNVSNIIRNQAISWSNIIRNQVQSARNTMTSSFISMRNVARNQMVAISNIIRNQAVTWSNIIRNQAANMRSAMTSAFAGMAASARAGMANVLSIVRSYMAQIRSETSKTMTMHFKVDKTVTTTNVSKNVTEGLRNTMGAISRGMASISAPQAISIGGYATSMSSIGGLAAGGSITLDVPLYIDGKEVARATAVYNEQELAKLAKRNNRKRGE